MAVVVALLVLLLVALPVGAAQIDEVVRAWGGQQAVVAVLVTVAAALVVVGAVRELTGDTPECPRPCEGRDPQPLLLVLGIGLAVVGAVVWLVTGAWGLLVPAAMALGVFLLGAAVCLVTTWTIARASTYDVLVRPGPSGRETRPL